MGDHNAGDVSPGTPQIASALVFAGSLVGIVMAIQPTSLMIGTGSIWTGAALAVSAAIGSLIMWRLTPVWIKALAVLAAVGALIVAVQLEIDMQEKRDEMASESLF